MDYEKKYNNALERAKKLYEQGTITESLSYVFPELKGSDERIRKEIIEYIKTGTYHKDWIAWLEKQDNKPVNIDIESMVSSYKQRLESQGNGGMKNNPLVNMCLTAFKHGVEEVLQELNLKEFEKPQGESESERIRRAIKVIKEEEKIDNANKVEPKFKVKYAGSEYDVIEIKEFPGGIIYYGIEDEPNHIDYVLPENCEIISGYGVNEKGSPYPTKPAIFSGQNPAWSEEDDYNVQCLAAKVTSDIQNGNVGRNQELIDWLKSIKDRVQPQNLWKPSEEQIQCLYDAIEHYHTNGYPASKLNELYEQMSKIYKL